MKRMVNNRLLEVLASDLAQLAVVELAKIYAEPDEVSCPKGSNHAVQGINKEPGTHKAQET